MNAFFTYVLLGISLSAPIGPVNAAQLDRGARFGFIHAWLIGLGATCADAVYMLLTFFGLAHFLSTPFMKTFLLLFGCFVLMYTGVETLYNMKSPAEAGKRDAQSTASSFRSGFIMALTNPLSILFWLGIYGSILTESMHNYGITQVLWHSIGIFAGILLWDVVIAALASSFYKFGGRSTLQTISALAGLSLIGFGIYFGYQAFLQLTHQA